MALSAVALTRALWWPCSGAQVSAPEARSACFSLPERRGSSGDARGKARSSDGGAEAGSGGSSLFFVPKRPGSRGGVRVEAGSGFPDGGLGSGKRAGAAAQGPDPDLVGLSAFFLYFLFLFDFRRREFEPLRKRRINLDLLDETGVMHASVSPWRLPRFFL